MKVTRKVKKLTSVFLCVMLFLGITVSGNQVIQVEASTPFTTEPMVSAGSNHTLALRSDGIVLAWGGNSGGQIGDGSTTTRFSPVQVQGLSNIVAVAGGGRHSLALRNDGTVWGWGWNELGAVGDGTFSNRLTPVQVRELNNIISIEAGDFNSVALCEDGTVWAWGRNIFGELGDGTTNNRNIPVQVPNLSNIIAVDVGGAHTVALRDDGTVWAWGNNEWGQLGDGTNTSRTVPVQVRDLNQVIAISAGSIYSMALRSDGTVWTWGDNEWGQLGYDTPLTDAGNWFTLTPDTNLDWLAGIRVERNTPGQVPNLNNVVEISAGCNHALARRNDGTIWAWGLNYNGQVGDGTRAYYRLSPIQVQNLSNAVTMTADCHHSVAIRNDGTVWAWGRSEDGQVGDGSLMPYRTAPVQTQGLGGTGFLNLNVQPAQPPAAETPSSWAVEHVQRANALGLVPAHLNSSFSQATTRAEFTALAVALYESVMGEITGRVTFADTNDVNVEKMAYLGVVSGVGNNRFDPNARLTREQAAVMISRLADSMGHPLPRQAATFADNAAVSSWAVDGVGHVQAAGIMSGVGNNRFAPQDPYTREQSIITMLRLFDIVN